LDNKFFDGDPSAEGSKDLAAMGYVSPLLTRGAPELTRAHDACRGWRKLAPQKTRLPLPLGLTCALINQMMKANQAVQAEALAVTFAFYLRPSVTLGLRVEDVVPPPRGARGAKRKWSLILHPQECEIPSKVGLFDEAMLLDNPEFMFLGKVLAARARASPGGSPMFPVRHLAWAQSLADAAAQLGLEGRGKVPVLYQLRHGGASHEMLTGFRSLEALKRRGRWASDASVRRYEKGGRIGQVLSRLDTKLQDHCRRCAAQIGKILAGSCLAWP
jgi:hypothetical protein